MTTCSLTLRLFMDLSNGGPMVCLLRECSTLIRDLKRQLSSRDDLGLHLHLTHHRGNREMVALHLCCVSTEADFRARIECK